MAKATEIVKFRTNKIGDNTKSTTKPHRHLSFSDFFSGAGSPEYKVHQKFLLYFVWVSADRVCAELADVREAASNRTSIGLKRDFLPERGIFGANI